MYKTNPHPVLQSCRVALSRSPSQELLGKPADVAAIREQLERMLAGPLFAHSRRYPAMLRYIVEQTLAGYAADLKERTLGIVVFGRDPNYDTALDPVVRTTAGEIRKRIAQYYQEPGREREIRINLSPGSYVPEFLIPAEHPSPVVPSEPASGSSVPPVAVSSSSVPKLAKSFLISALLLMAALLVALVWLKPWKANTALDRFWRPVVESSEPVLLCIGQRRFLGAALEPGQEANGDIERLRQSPHNPLASSSLFQLYYMGSQNAALPDVATFGRLSGLLQTRGKRYHMLTEYSTSYADLQKGPVVLIGAFNNDWTMRLAGAMRFNFEREGEIFRIRDRQNPSERKWAVDYTLPYMNLTSDYALISRVLEPTTDRMVVVVAGLTGFGTTAAGEFLTDPKYLNALAQTAPPGWDRRNIQVLIETNVIRGVSGPPRVVERHLW